MGKSRGGASLGFTVIELVMVLVIISSFIILAGPRYFSTTPYNQQVFYDEVLNSVRYARKLAIGHNAHIQVSLTSNSITLQQRVEGSSCTVGTKLLPIIDPATHRVGYVKTLQGNVSITFSSNWPLYFNGLGQALKASNCTVINTDTISLVGGNTIKVFGETGVAQ